MEGWIIAGFLAVIVIVLIVQLLTKKKGSTDVTDKIEKTLDSIVDNLNNTNNVVNDFLYKSNESANRQYNQNISLINQIAESQSRALNDLTEKITQVEDTNREVLNFASSLKSIENILINQKSRGVFGEGVLASILKSFLPGSMYSLQHTFEDSDIVDAVIKLHEYVIPIDAKFPLDSYNKYIDETQSSEAKKYQKKFFSDTKKRILETSKYIKPQYNTTDFSIMFIPAEGVYHEIMSLNIEEESIIEFALKHNVIMVSPMSFFAYLQTIIRGLQLMKIEKNIGNIIKNLELSNKYVKEFQENMHKLGRNLSMAMVQYDKLTVDVNKISSNINKITDQ